MFKGQAFHTLFLVLCFFSLTKLAVSFGNEAEFWGLSATAWYWIAILIPVIHQIFVWLVWRMELYYQYFTKNFGATGFKAYFIDFFILFIGRFVALCCLAIADQGSIDIADPLKWGLSLLILVPGIYTMFSVRVYFSFKRAVGLDHFDPEIRKLPLVKKGMFKYTPNAMYTFALQMLWIFGLLAESQLALIVAAFESIYIWVHYFCTEKPDMEIMYGKD
ncbi:MAG TPA: hypothetical protein EYQ86_04525 [Bacteroidetes bacterium]|nr:hypothetical protein [Bacteroidota bacterium]